MPLFKIKLLTYLQAELYTRKVIYQTHFYVSNEDPNAAVKSVCILKMESYIRIRKVLFCVIKSITGWLKNQRVSYWKDAVSSLGIVGYVV